MNLEPIFPIIKDELSSFDKERYEYNGMRIIREAKVAVCTLAGGQGTRLGHNGPKGTFLIPFTTIEPISIFELMANYLLKVHLDYNSFIHWFIMTSNQNDNETKDFFEKNNYFNYPKEKITFFVQGELPLLNRNREELKDKNGNVITAANGNGGIFKALEDEHILQIMEKEKIDYLVTCNVDNILVNPIDDISLRNTC